MSNFSNRIVVKFTPEDSNFIGLTTYDVIHGRSLKFLIFRHYLTRFTDEDMTAPVLDCDIGNFLQISRKKDTISFRLTWLQQDCRGNVNGYVQSFFLPMEKVRAVLDGQTVNHVEYLDAEPSKARLTITEPGNSMIQKIYSDKLNRNALRKFFRDHFNYGRDERFILYPDPWVKGFFFQSASDGFSGGIVRHEDKVIGKNGQLHKKVYYAIHT